MPYLAGVFFFAGDFVTFISNLLGVAIRVFWNLEGFLLKGLFSKRLLYGALLAVMDSIIAFLSFLTYFSSLFFNLTGVFATSEFSLKVFAIWRIFSILFRGASSFCSLFEERDPGDFLKAGEILAAD
jgi:hypothetical protein